MSKRLLIVDDDSSVRDSLKNVLEQAGHNVILAQGGIEAQARLNDALPDLLILDLNMPQGDGWEVLEDVSLNRPLLPVMVITGMTDQLATLNIPGVVSLMKKPVDVSSFLKAVEELLAESSDERLRRISRSYEGSLLYQMAGVSPIYPRDYPSKLFQPRRSHASDE
jgi:DNA-binding NtrC family response regulator